MDAQAVTHMQRFAWGFMTFMATGVAAYAVLVLVLPGFGPPFIGALRAAAPWSVTSHIAGGLAALAVGPWQFNTRLRTRHLAVHRWMGRTYVSAVLIGGIGGLALAAGSQEGLVTHVGFGLLAVFWLATT